MLVGREEPAPAVLVKGGEWSCEINDDRPRCRSWLTSSAKLVQRFWKEICKIIEQLRISWRSCIWASYAPSEYGNDGDYSEGQPA